MEITADPKVQLNTWYSLDFLAPFRGKTLQNKPGNKRRLTKSELNLLRSFFRKNETHVHMLQYTEHSRCVNSQKDRTTQTSKKLGVEKFYIFSPKISMSASVADRRQTSGSGEETRPSLLQNIILYITMVVLWKWSAATGSTTKSQGAVRSGRCKAFSGSVSS